MHSDRPPPASALVNATALLSGARRAWLRQLLTLAAAASVSSWPRAARATGLAVGQPAPPLMLHSLDGRTIATTDLRGQIVIVTFWATWCAPCREELPLLSDFAATHAQDGLQVLGFSLDGRDNLSAVEKVAHTLRFPVGLLGSAWAGGYGRIWRIPVSFVINRAGILVDNGWDDEQPVWTTERLERIVMPLLRKPG